MTATLVAAPTFEEGSDPATGLWSAIEPEFLELLQWDPQVGILRFPESHPLLGWKSCLAPGCGKRTERINGLCTACHIRYQASGCPSLEEFTVLVRPRQRTMTDGPCAVRQCQRPWSSATAALCTTHNYQRERILRLSLEDFLAHPDVLGLPTFGPCDVAACTRHRIGRGPYCRLHATRWRKYRQHDGSLTERQWRRAEAGPAITREVNLRALPSQVVAEVIYGLQQSVKYGVRAGPEDLRPYCDRLRFAQVTTVHELPRQERKATQALHSRITKYARQHGLSPETERHKDEWDCVVFGHGGSLQFTGISQRWLREAVKAWAFDDLPKRRGNGVVGTVSDHIRALAELSDSVRLHRDDGGGNPASLAREDITMFLNRLAYRHAQGEISASQRMLWCRFIRRMLAQMRGMGLSRHGQPLHGLPEDFTLTAEDMPDEPEDAEAGQDLPVEVMRHLCEHLEALDQRGCPEARVVIELLIDTGRRPNEVCQLRLDCLDRDADGKPVLIYDNFKAHRHDRRLPIPEATASLITRQQQRVRERFPDEPANQLKLLPATTRNPVGRRAITDGWVGRRHRDWVAGLPDVVVPMMIEAGGKLTTATLPFDRARIFPYALRHSYVISPGSEPVRDVGYDGRWVRASRVSGTCRYRWLRSPRGRVDQHWVPGRAGSVTARRRRVVGGTRR